MAQLIAANNAQSTLAGSISNTATTANLASGSGILFAAPSAGQYFVGTFTDAATGLLHEIVWVTNVTGDQITMQRAQEGTTGLNWSANDLFGNLMTAGQLETLVQVAQAQEQNYNYGVDTGAVNAYLIALTPAIGTAPTAGMPIRMVALNTNTGASTLNAGWGAVAIKRRDGSALIGNEILANVFTELFWNGAVFEYIDTAPATSAAIAAGTDTESAVTPAQLAAALGSGKVISGQCYLQLTSSTAITLMPKNGNNVPNAGNILQLPAAGVTGANTGVLLNGTPASNLVASTVYLVALNASSQLEYWTLGTGHSPSSTSGNIGVEIITGHNDKTLVGMIRTNSSAQFVDTDASRFVVSWFNKQLKPSKSTFTGNPNPGTQSGVAEIDTSIRNGILVWSGVSVPFAVAGNIEGLGGNTSTNNGIAFDGTSPELEGAATASPSGLNNTSIGFSGIKEGLSEGYHYGTLVYSSNSTPVYQGGSTPFSSPSTPSPCVLDLSVFG
jgi:hypothetical protein